ncbi:MAG: DUF4276 family protein [Bacteroidetes bacterium]|nr:DUF4276 family protein [Bacteroidota bacterium]
MITTGRDRHRHHLTHKGGLNKFGHAYREIHRCIMEDKTALCTTMFDLYQIPEDFPGYQQSSKIIDPYERVDTLEKWLAEKIDNRRFIPYIQIYEFETLLFSDIQKLQMQHPDFIDQINKLAETTSTFKSPELINDGKLTAPSKRIIQSVPECPFYKQSYGPVTAERIGMPVLLSKCRHFREWIERLCNAQMD